MTQRLAGRYLIGDRIGTGGTSHVFAAYDELLGREVAVKSLDATLAATADPAGRERFLREGRSAASFSHRHAVTVFDAGEDDGELFIVLELVRGPSLAQHLAETNPLPIDDAVCIARQVGSALGAAHAIGVVHRDVKPSNILLDSAGEAKLTDFGLARRFDDLEAAVTAVGMVAGSPKYLAPEQAVGGAITPATDVYALGVVMFEMLTGRVPFDGGSTTATAALRRSTEAPDVRTLRPETPAALAAVITRALRRDPAGRQPNAQVLVDELDAAALQTALDPVVPGVVDVMERTQLQPLPAAIVEPRRQRRSGAAVGALAALGFLAVVLVVGATSDPGDDTSADPAVIDTTIGPTTVPPVEPSATTTEAAGTTAPAETVAVEAPVVPEVIPGFPVTDDLTVFLAQLEQDPLLVGPAGPELADQLGQVLDVKPRKKRDAAADDLSGWVEQQAEDGTLDPAIAALAVDLLDSKGPGNRDD